MAKLKKNSGFNPQPKAKPLSESNDVICPKCNCDYVVPIMKINFTRSFAGNRMTVTWPSREGLNDYATVACAECGEVLSIQQTGEVKSLEKKLGAGGKKT